MTTGSPRSVSRVLTVDLIDASGTARPLQAALSYDAADPYAVAAAFDLGDTQVRWVLSRDLLSTGIFDPIGDGDVHAWPCLDARGHAVTILELSSPDGAALLQARSEDLLGFLTSTASVVAPGAESEHVDLEAELATLLG